MDHELDLSVTLLDGTPVEAREVEIVERKGLGHPDSICDALAERLSAALSGFYSDRFGLILHHNVDKVLLRGGSARPAFGGGQVLEPIEIYLAGRATTEVEGVRVPVEELAVEASRAWVGEIFHALDPRRHLRIYPLIRPGSQDLIELYRRQERTGRRLANDTSCGVGYAPLSPLERLVLQAERELNAGPPEARSPELGQDVKVMGVRRGDRIRLTVACAMVDRYLDGLDSYAAAKDRLAERLHATIGRHLGREVEIAVNTADDPAAGSVYLTVTGTSAEAGDDGQTGRGNRVNGLITPCRPMTMESVAGKNPITHVGKLYNIAASLLAETVVQQVPTATAAQCLLVSQIGRPIEEPQVVDVRVRPAAGAVLSELRSAIVPIVRQQLDGLGSLSGELLAGRVAVDRWPLRRV